MHWRDGGEPDPLVDPGWVLDRILGYRAWELRSFNPLSSTQVGHTGPLRSSETGRPIPYLEDVALDFPELKIVCGHIGVPWMNEMLSLLHKFPNVYMDTSAYTVQRYPRELVDYLKGRGGERVLFRTNYPMITAANCLEDIDGLGLDDELRTLFLRGNAERMFGL